MKISVIIPTYNHERYISYAIDSVLQQTRPVDEIFVVDDGSKDGTRQLVEEKYGSKVRYIYQKNAGVGAARNNGIRHASGDWIAVLDADDGWDPDKIRLQEKAIQKNPEVAFVYTATKLLHPDGSLSDRSEHFVGADRIWPTLRYTNRITMSSVMFRRQAVLDVGGFSERLTSCEDWDTWVRLRLRHPFASVAEPVTITRVTLTSMSMNIQRMIDNMEAIREGTLLAGLPAWKWPFWTRLIRSNAYFHAAVSSRELGDAAAVRRYMRRSIAQWPSPAFLSNRYRILLHDAIGADTLSRVRSMVAPGRS